jgi:hypothetical protein
LITTGHFKDVTTDVTLMYYVFNGKLLEDSSVTDKTRVLAAAKIFLVRDGKLYITGKLGWREVPAIAERYNII